MRILLGVSVNDGRLDSTDRDRLCSSARDGDFEVEVIARHDPVRT